MSDSRAFKKLQKLWSKKLSQSGFEDIEQPDGRLKKWEAHFFRQRPDASFQEAKAAYYRMAGSFLHEHLFEDEATKIIWAMHAEGFGQRAIIKELRRRGLRGHFDFVGSTIRRLSEEMKKTYQNDQQD